VNKLNAKKVQGKLKPGMHNDGGGLYLRVSKSGARSWILRCRIQGKKRDIGLGGISLVSLADARKKAIAMRAVAREGGDPKADEDRIRNVPTFEKAARLVWQSQIVPTAKNEKHKAQWITTLRDYAFPQIGTRGVDVIQSGDILRVLQPIWLEKPATAVRVRQRLRTVFDWAIAAQHRTAGNPVSGIETALPKQPKSDSHHAAMPFEDVPQLFSQIGDTPVALCLRFLILTAARTGEARLASWSEIDGDIWTIPANRMKAGIAHRVPLSPEAVAILDRARGFSENLIFPGHRHGRPIVDTTLRDLLRRLGHPYTVHGFRSTFRDWAAERTNVPREIAELCLAHEVGSVVERAYRRSDLFDKRRDLMGQWGRFCCPASADVIEIGGRV
jgi:integrase